MSPAVIRPRIVAPGCVALATIRLWGRRIEPRPRETRCVARQCPADAGSAMEEQVTAWSGPPHPGEGCPCRNPRHDQDGRTFESTRWSIRCLPPDRGDAHMRRGSVSASRPHLAQVVRCELEHLATIPSRHHRSGRVPTTDTPVADPGGYPHPDRMVNVQSDVMAPEMPFSGQ